MKIVKTSIPLVGAAITAALITVAGLSNPTFAAADTCTWTGAADGTTMSNAGNWTGCDNGGAPETTDTLAFGTTPGNFSLTNDLGFPVSGLLVNTGTGTPDITIDTIELTDGATVTDHGEGGSVYTNVMVENLTALGDVTFTGDGGRFSMNNTTIAGVTTVTDGYRISATRIGSNGVIVQKDSALSFFTTAASTFPITLGGGAGTANPVIEFYDSATPYSFTNPITLLGDATVQLLSFGTGVQVNQTGSITGAGFALSLDAVNSSEGTTLTLAPSSNTSATVPGTYTGTGAVLSGGGGGSAPEEGTTPKAPDTGFTLNLANPLAVVAGGLAAIVALAVVGRKLVRR